MACELDVDRDTTDEEKWATFDYGRRSAFTIGLGPGGIPPDIGRIP